MLRKFSKGHVVVTKRTKSDDDCWRQSNPLAVIQSGGRARARANAEYGRIFGGFLLPQRPRRQNRANERNTQELAALPVTQTQIR